jgi:hydrogenase expression/formation protein HypE
MLGLAPAGRLVTTGGARPGDVVVQIGPVPVEGAAVLAAEAGDRLQGVDTALLDAARHAAETPGTNVVAAALLAADLGATSLHDPTEGGLASGLHEVARAAGVALHVRRDAVCWFAPGVAVCNALGADPWATIASGCVLAAFPASSASAAIAGLQRAGHCAVAIGEARAGTGVSDERGAPLLCPDRDEVARVLAG